MIARTLRKTSELMPFRVREILILSSEYDAYILEEEGNLSDQIFLEYKSLSLSSAPRILHVTTREEAFELLARRQFDLLLIVAREAHEDLIELGRQIKQIRPGQVVSVLGFQSTDRALLKALVCPDALDSVFVWSGDSKILLAIIKGVEDRANIDNDIAVAGVRVILVVEDSIRYYSAFLSALYPELMKQSQSLFAEGPNRVQKFMRMRTRPKVLHATSYEQALLLFTRYRDNLLAVISDMGFPRKGEYEATAGFALAREIRAVKPDLPLLLQSAETAHQAEVERLCALFVNKNSTSLLQSFRDFLHNQLGFGPFVFRSPEGREVTRAKDIDELYHCVKTAPDESLRFHSLSDHFSNWLMARSEFELAERLKLCHAADFGSVEEMRSYLVRTFEDYFHKLRQGVVVDFSIRSFDTDSLFQRIGDGNLGGKARGMAFLNHLISKTFPPGETEGLDVQIPQTFVITTDAFERFVEENDIYRRVAECRDDREIIQQCLEAVLPGELIACLSRIVRHVDGPLAVRSSSLLEDDMFHPFAGIYKTVMIPNNQPSQKERLRDLCRAVQIVYASTYFQNARSYLANTAHSIEEERMAVLVQRMVGQTHGGHFYPHFSGVAHSYNYYPIGPQRAEDGVVQMVLGLGRMVVDGGQVMRFCPRFPLVRPQFGTPQLTVKNSQRTFYGLDLARPWYDPESDFDANQMECDLTVALAEGTFRAVGSVYDAPNDVITEGDDVQGPLVVTFNNILKYRQLPFAPVMDRLLQVITRGIGSPVEVEFACDLGTASAPDRKGSGEVPPRLYLLQVRPIMSRESMLEISTTEVDPARVFCRSEMALGNGHFEDIRDILFVKPETFNPQNTRKIAREVGLLNAKLVQAARPYVLIGPGRWGSSDHWLGIPVQWAQISGARIVVEAGLPRFNVEPSQGTHFFHNLTALRLGYLTVPPAPADVPPHSLPSFVDWAWLQAQPLAEETAFLKHVTPPEPILVSLDGRKSLGVLAHA